jgi:hypothetical protein
MGEREGMTRRRGREAQIREMKRKDRTGEEEKAKRKGETDKGMGGKKRNGMRERVGY